MVENRMNGKIGIWVKGDALDFDKINLATGIAPSKIVRKGEVLSRVTGPSSIDIWSVEERYVGNQQMEEKCEELLKRLIASSSFKDLAKKYHVECRCFVQSDSAQIQFRLPKAILRDLVELDIDLTVSVFSWGHAD